MILAILWATALFGYLFIKLRRLDRDFLLRVNTIIEKRALVNAALDDTLGKRYPYTKIEDDLMPTKVKTTKVTVKKKEINKPMKKQRKAKVNVRNESIDAKDIEISAFPKKPLGRPRKEKTDKNPRTNVRRKWTKK